MESNNGSKPAYPTEGREDENGRFVGIQTGPNSGTFGGLTKREVFAMAAMQARLTGLVMNESDYMPSMVAELSVKDADELLKQLES